MIGSARQVAVHAFAVPVDMRKTFDSLSLLVMVQGLGRDVLWGDLFLFVSKNRPRAKVLSRVRDHRLERPRHGRVGPP